MFTKLTSLRKLIFSDPLFVKDPLTYSSELLLKEITVPVIFS